MNTEEQIQTNAANKKEYQENTNLTGHCPLYISMNKCKKMQFLVEDWVSSSW